MIDYRGQEVPRSGVSKLGIQETGWCSFSASSSVEAGDTDVPAQKQAG